MGQKEWGWLMLFCDYEDSFDSSVQECKDYILDQFETCNARIRGKILADFDDLCAEKLTFLGFQDISTHASKNCVEITAYKNNILFEINCLGKPKSKNCTGDIFKETLLLCIQSLGHVNSVDVQQNVSDFFEKNGFLNIELFTRSVDNTDGSVNGIHGTVEKNNIQFEIRILFDQELLIKKYGTKIIYNDPGKRETVSFDNMEGHQFEFFCADLLRKCGYENVTVTQGSGDQGIDIIACRDDVRYGIQCKCYSSTIGNKAVQEVFAGKAFHQCHVGVVLTNNYFTNSAIEFAQRNGIILWDRDKLIKFIESAK